MSTDTAKPKRPAGKAKSDPAAQHAKFVEAAKQAGADGDDSAADTLMGRLGKTRPNPKN